MHVFKSDNSSSKTSSSGSSSEEEEEKVDTVDENFVQIR